MNRDAIEREIDEIELLLADDRLSDDVRYALQGAQQALRWVLDGEAASTRRQ